MSEQVSAYGGENLQLNVDEAYKQALIHYNADNFHEVEIICNTILKSSPYHIDAINLLGIIAQKNNRHDLAVKEFQRAININNSIALLHFNLAVSKVQLGEIDVAIQILNSAITIEPDNLQISQYLHEITSEQQNNNLEYESQKALDKGVACHNAGKLDDAMAFYKQSLDYQPQNFNALSNFGFALQAKGEIVKAVEYYKKAITINPNFALAYNNLGFALAELGKLDESITVLQNAIAIEPNYAQAHYNLGNTQQMQQKFDDAIFSFKAAIAIKPDYFESHYNLGNAYMVKERVYKAIASYKKAVKLNPDFAKLYINYGVALRETGQLEEAVKCFKKAIAINPHYAQAHNNLGVTLKEQGKIKKAVASFNRAIKIKPDYAEAYGNLASSKKYTNISEIDEMQSVLSRLHYEKDKIHLNFALGKAFADIEQYDDSFKYYLAGNQLKRATINFDIGKLAQTFKLIRHTFDKKFFKAVGRCGCEDETPVFILGMPRSGSSLIEQILSSHKDVFGGGELPFLKDCFPSGFFNNIAENSQLLQGSSALSLGEKYIERLREIEPKAKYIVDKMPHNFMFIGVIKIILPNAKIIHSFRSPEDTCLSIYRSDFVGMHEYAYDLKELGEYYQLYSGLMSHWQSLFPNSIYNCHYEKLTHNQKKETKKMLDFLGLGWSENCINFHKTERNVRTASDFQVRQKIYTSSVNGYKRYEDQLQPLLKALRSPNKK
ncbi:MAG: tetratricopeptide repeat protein [Magnetococcales bacterium]|nr:tetratricopeptide repeat protein [Magnetococcales bacterium]